jgi:hypothetical protein
MWRKIQKDELHDLHTSSNILRAIKQARMKWEVRVARTGERRGAYTILVGKPEERDQLEDLGPDGRIILKRIIKEWHGPIWTGFIWLRIDR